MATTTEKFTVDALLLRELGERLVGRPEVALAELIKNAYDADASVVEVDLSNGVLSVIDDGHGMTVEEFKKRWMRVGTNLKETEQRSPYRDRPLTGSKGVGRLAAQILGTQQHLESRSGDPLGNGDPNAPAFRAHVDWKMAQKQGELVEATAEVESPLTAQQPVFAEGSLHGTRVEIHSLTSGWSARQIDDVAKQVWLLQPPMLRAGDAAFLIRLTGEFAPYAQDFQRRVANFLTAGWSARIHARLVADVGQPCSHEFVQVEAAGDPGRFGWRTIAVQGARTTKSDENSQVLELRTATAPGSDEVLRRIRVRESTLSELEYDVRRFGQSGRQRGGVLLKDVRRYLTENGGVHVFDSGFKLAYYNRERDWLGLTADIARRLGRLELLEGIVPDAPLHRAGLNLPTTRELYGEVRISSASAAQQDPGDSDGSLILQITRDRLMENRAYRELVALVRLGLEWYAHDVEIASLKKLQNSLVEDRLPSVEIARDGLIELARSLPNELQSMQIELVTGLEKRTRLERNLATRQVVLVSALASAGMSALATFHDFAKNAERLDSVKRVLEGTSTGADALTRALSAVEGLEASLAQWGYFYAPFRHASDREEEGRVLVGEVVARILPMFRNPSLARGADFDASIDDDMTFPPGLYPAWHAVLQNVLLNSLAATLHTPHRRVALLGTVDGDRSRLDVSDTGVGVNLALSSTYFEPWRQGPAASPESIELGLSGSGLGLFIVQTVCNTYGVSARFVKPVEPYSTCLRFEWQD